MLIIICSKPVVAINIYQKVCWKNPRISNITSGCYESEVDNFIFKNDKNLLWDEIGKKKSSKLLNTWFLRIVIKISSKMTHFYAYFDINFRTKLSYWFKKKKSPFLTIFELWLGRLDSNQRMSAPKADALPLGDAPTKSIQKTKQRALFINFSILLYAIFFIIASIFFKKNHNFLFFVG